MIQRLLLFKSGGGKEKRLEIKWISLWVENKIGVVWMITMWDTSLEGKLAQFSIYWDKIRFISYHI